MMVGELMDILAEYDPNTEVEIGHYMYDGGVPIESTYVMEYDDGSPYITLVLVPGGEI